MAAFLWDMAETNRDRYDEYPGMPTNKPENYPERAKRRSDFTEKLRRHLEDILGYDEIQVEKYLYELRQELGDQKKKIKQINKDIKNLGLDRDQGSVGHMHPVSKTINSPANRQLESRTPNVLKADNYSISPEAQTAIGNSANPKRSFFDNWVNDFLVWADRKENGGTGVMPQRRRTYKPKTEMLFYRLGGGDKGESYDKLSHSEQLKVRNHVDDLTTRLDDGRPAHDTGTKYERRWTKPLSAGDAETARAIQEDPDDWKGGSKHKENGHENGHSNGKKGNGHNGHGLSIDAKAGGLRTADQLLNLGTSLATGDAVGATISGGTLAIGQTLKNPAVQKKVASQVAELVAKRGAKTAAKLIPGLDIYLSGRETMGYLGQGRLGQAGIAALSGAVGWIPGIGDAASAALDITNTGIDIARLQPQSRGGDNKKNRFNRRTTASLASLNSINLK